MVVTLVDGACLLGILFGDGGDVRRHGSGGHWGLPELFEINFLRAVFRSVVSYELFFHSFVPPPWYPVSSRRRFSIPFTERLGLIKGDGRYGLVVSSVPLVGIISSCPQPICGK